MIFPEAKSKDITKTCVSFRSSLISKYKRKIENRRQYMKDMDTINELASMLSLGVGVISFLIGILILLDIKTPYRSFYLVLCACATVFACLTGRLTDILRTRRIKRMNDLMESMYSDWNTAVPHCVVDDFVLNRDCETDEEFVQKIFPLIDDFRTLEGHRKDLEFEPRVIDAFL